MVNDYLSAVVGLKPLFQVSISVPGYRCNEMNYVVAFLDNLVIRISIRIVPSVNSVCIKWLSVRFCPDLSKSGNNKIFTWLVFFNFYQTGLTSSFNKKMIDLHNWIYYFVFNWRNHYYFHLIKQIHSRCLIKNTLAMGHIISDKKVY